MVRKKAVRQSIIRQLLAIGLVFLLVLMAAFVITNIQLKSMRQKNTLAFNEQNMTQIADEIENYREMLRSEEHTSELQSQR